MNQNSTWSVVLLVSAFYRSVASCFFEQACERMSSVVVEPMVAYTVLDHAMRCDEEKVLGLLIGVKTSGVITIRNLVPLEDLNSIKATSAVTTFSPQDTIVQGWYVVDKPTTDQLEFFSKKLSTAVCLQIKFNEQSLPEWKAHIINKDSAIEAPVSFTSETRCANVIVKHIQSQIGMQTAKGVSLLSVDAGFDANNSAAASEAIRKRFDDVVASAKKIGAKDPNAKALNDTLAQIVKEREALGDAIDGRTQDALLLKYIAALIRHQVSLLESNVAKKK